MTTTAVHRPSWMDAFRLGERIPEGTSGPWRVVRKTVSKDAAALDRLQSVYSSRRGVPEGVYTGLIHERRGLMMSDTPDEMRDHIGAYLQAKRYGGRCLVHGLGLGMVTQALLSLENVEHVDVVEIDADVIALVAPAFQEDVDAGRLTIHHDDCFTKRWPPGTHWTVGWSDIWIDITEDNLPEMATLRRKFARRCDWHDCWCREILVAQRRRDARSGWGW